MDETLIQEQETVKRPFVTTSAARGTILRTLATWRRVLSAHKAEAVSACLLVALAANLFTVILRKSITNDEIVHIPAGYYHLVEGYFQLNNEHPPLIKMWAALPLLFIQPEEPPPPKDVQENFMERTWGYHARFWPQNQAHYETLTFWPRVMMLPLTLALGVLIFYFTRRHFGARAGALAVALFCLEPTVLAHGRVVHTDMPSALAYLLTFFTLEYYWRKRTVRSAALVGLVTALALITKFSMIVLLPLLACALVLCLALAPRLGLERKRLALHAGLVAAVVLFVVNAAYYFQSPPIEPSDVEWVEMKSAPIFDELMTGFRVFSSIVPTYFLFGLYNVVIHNQYGHPASLLGQHGYMGWWYYFPVAFALKTTLPFLLLTVASLAWGLWRCAARRDRRFLFLVVPLVIFVSIAMSSHINIGIRHFFPAFPFFFILGGALLERLLRLSRLRIAALLLVAASFGWMSYEALRAYPDYIPYMNELASAQPRWHYLSDSNVEWGDDLGALALYLRARGERQVRGALSGGWGTLPRYGVEYFEMARENEATLPRTAYVAIGASFLNGSTVMTWEEEEGTGRLVDEERRYNYFARYRDLQPEAVFGHSIYLYRVQE